MHSYKKNTILTVFNFILHVRLYIKALRSESRPSSSFHLNVLVRGSKYMKSPPLV